MVAQVTEANAKNRLPWRGLILQPFIAALVGLQFGLLEVFIQHRGGFDVGARAAMEIGIFYLLSGLGFGLAAAAGTGLLLALLPRSVGRLLVLAPTFFVIFMMTGITIGARDLRSPFAPASLAVDLFLLIGVLLLWWIWRRRPWGGRVDAALLGLLILANVGVWLGASRFGREAHVQPTGTQGAAAEGSPNIFLILIDTLRADHVGIYGYERATTPNMDRWGGQGTVFERAYSVSNWSRPAVASLHNSTMPSRHGTHDVDLGLSPSLPLIAQVLKGMGYQNVFVTMGVQVQPEDGYARGVDHFYHARPRGAVDRSALMPFYRIVLPSVPRWVWAMFGWREDSDSPDKLNAKALAFARQLEAERPVFMYMHYAGAHTPYVVPPPYNVKFTDRSLRRRPVKGLHDIKDAEGPLKEDLKYWIAQYDGQILWHDVHVGRLLDGLRALHRLDNAIVVLAGDHGEGFGEHGVWDHGRGLFDEIVRVPLIFWTTQAWNKAQRLEVPASLLDVAPTLIELAGGEAPVEWDGGSLGPWLRGERQDANRVVFQENVVTKELGLRNAEWAYFEHDRGGEVSHWLYKAEDRRQENELSGRYPDLVEEFHLLVTERARIDEERGTGAPRVDIDAAREEMLREMGYVK